MARLFARQSKGGSERPEAGCLGEFIVGTSELGVTTGIFLNDKGLGPLGSGRSPLWGQRSKQLRRDGMRGSQGAGESDERAGLECPRARLDARIPREEDPACGPQDMGLGNYYSILGLYRDNGKEHGN